MTLICGEGWGCGNVLLRLFPISCMHAFFKASASSFHGWDDESGGVLSNHPPVTGTAKDWKEYAYDMHMICIHIRTQNETKHHCFYTLLWNGQNWNFRQSRFTPRMSIHPAGGHRARHPRVHQRWRCWSQRSNSKVTCAFQAVGRCKSKIVYRKDT